MDTAKYQKIFSALELPMKPDERLDYDALSQLIEYELSIGVEGFYCMGSSGEALLLSLDERKQALEHIMSAVQGRVPVIAHVGTIRTADAISLACHAASLSVDAVSMIPPYYYKFSMAEITAYYRDVMDAVPELPMIVYNIPQFTGIEFNKGSGCQAHLQQPLLPGADAFRLSREGLFQWFRRAIRRCPHHGCAGHHRHHRQRLCPLVPESPNPIPVRRYGKRPPGPAGDQLLCRTDVPGRYFQRRQIRPHPAWHSLWPLSQTLPSPDQGRTAEDG